MSNEPDRKPQCLPRIYPDCIAQFVMQSFKANRASPRNIVNTIGATNCDMKLLLLAFGRIVAAWWAGFLVVTITGERLELSRLTRISSGNRLLLFLGIALFVLYEQCEQLAGAQADEILKRLKTAPAVKMLPHVDNPFVMEAARRALQRAGYDLML